MIRKLRPGLLAAALALVLLVAGILGAAAQDESLRIGNAALQLWPEYDDPGVLVILSGTVTGTVSFPQRISIPVPAGARNIQATYRDASGTPINRDFEVTDGAVSYELPTPDFHLEYYFDRPPGGNDREIKFNLALSYPVQRMAITVQQPARASGFSLTPAAERSESREDGLSYHYLTRAGLAAGQGVELVVRYTKADAGLSQPQLAVTDAGSAQAPAAAPAPAQSTNWVPWLLIGFGVAALLGAGTYWYLNQRRGPAPATARPAGNSRQTMRPTVRASGPAVTGPGAFCTQCGKALRPDDRFCAQCGTPRRN